MHKSNYIYLQQLRSKADDQKIIDLKRQRLMDALNKKQEDIKTRQRIKEYIANYTTLPELERVADHDLKVLKRFIVK